MTILHTKRYHIVKQGKCWEVWKRSSVLDPLAQEINGKYYIHIGKTADSYYYINN